MKQNRDVYLITPINIILKILTTLRFRHFLKKIKNVYETDLSKAIRLYSDIYLIYIFLTMLF